MVVSIILDTEYMGMAERFKWFLKNCSYAKEQDYLIVTHEYIKTHLDELMSGCEERFFDEFEMRRLSRAELDELNIYYIPDKYFERIYTKCDSRTDMITKLYEDDCKEIYDFVLDNIDVELDRRKEKKPEYILNCLHVFKFVKRISEHYNVSIVPYVFSAIRKVHGYTQTLYMANISENLFNSSYAEELYKQYRANQHDVYNRKEILGMLGKRKNIPLIPLIDYEGENEIGVIGEGFHITPETFQHEKITDDDLFYGIKKNFGNIKVPVRMHPIQMDQCGIGRKHMKNDPVEFILSCKRLCTIQSQMILKAALWNRTSIAYGQGLPYSFLLQKDINSNNKTSVEDLNFILFGYFVPDSLMFDKNYWNWRLTKPDSNDIYEKNLKQILQNLGIDNIIETNDRFKMILKSRDITQYELNQVMSSKFNVTNSNCLLSKFVFKNELCENKVVYTLNDVSRDNVIETNVEFENDSQYTAADVFLLDGADGQITIEKITINDRECNGIDHKYFKKGEKTIDLTFSPKEPKIKIYIKWFCKNWDTIV